MIHGDLFSKIDQVQDGSIDLVIMVPKWEKIENPDRSWQDEKLINDQIEILFRKLTKPKGQVIFFVTMKQYPHIDHMMWGFKLKDFHIVVKGNVEIPENEHHPILNTEIILVYAKEEANEIDLTFNPYQGTTIKTTDGAVTNFSKNTKDSGNVGYGRNWIKTTIDAPLKKKKVADEGMVIPNQKPLEILRELIRVYTNPGDTILAPFAGLGNVLIAAKIENRNAVGFEEEYIFFKEAVSRLDQATPQIDLFSN